MIGDQHDKEEMAWRMPLFIEKLEEACKKRDSTAQVAVRSSQQMPFVVYEIDIYTKDVDDCYVVQYNRMTGEVRAMPAT